MLRSIHFRRDDKIIFRQALYRVRGEGYFHPPPSKLDIGMMSFTLGHCANFVYPCECLSEILEGVGAHHRSRVIAQSPTRHLLEQDFCFYTIERCDAPFTRYAFLGSEIHPCRIS